MLINEKILLREILDGKRINVYQMRFICSLLARHFLMSGFDEIETRNLIFAWANSHSYYVKLTLKKIVAECNRDLKELCEKEVYINNDDIEFIKMAAKTKLERKFALALICYSKAHSDVDDIFEAPISTIGDWIGQKSPHNLYTRIMPTLLSKGFFVNEEDVQKWHGKIIKRTRTMRLLYEQVNEGRYRLTDNDIDSLFKLIKWK